MANAVLQCGKTNARAAAARVATAKAPAIDRLTVGLTQQLAKNFCKPPPP